LGIRIEDTVLVTKDGYEILTREAPKTIEEIEKLMAERGLSEAIRD
jgi:Xaa-Pro aminopeptidase